MVSEEKVSPTVDLPPLMTTTAAAPLPPLAEPIGSNWYNNGYLRTKCGKLQLAQIILGVMAVVFTRPRSDANIEYVFLILCIHAPLLTAVALWDSLNGNKLRDLFGLDSIWEQLQLRAIAALAVLYYVAAFAMLMFFIPHYNPRTNILAGVMGMLASAAYGYHWWLLYREQVLRKKVAEQAAQAYARPPSYNTIGQQHV